MNDIECYLCGRSCDGSVSIRGGRNVCRECADKIDQKKPVLEDNPDFYYGYHGAYLFYKPIDIDTFYDMLDDYQTYGKYFLESMIVKLKYKYDHDKEWTIENVVLEFDGNKFEYCWLNDWDEGQQQKFVIGWILLSDVNFE